MYIPQRNKCRSPFEQGGKPNCFQKKCPMVGRMISSQPQLGPTRWLDWLDSIATRMSGHGKVESVVPVVVGYSLAIH